MEGIVLAAGRGAGWATRGERLRRRCFRSVTSSLVAYPHKARLHVPLRDREHIAYTKEDLSDLLELCDYFLRNPLGRYRLAANSQSFFDRYLHRDQLAADHLHSILARV
jgi:hypothetical protein